MIWRDKGDAPRILQDNKDAWTTELLSLLENNQDVPVAVWRRYAHPDVKDALIDASDGKCIYCESHIRHIDYGHIDHIMPKRLFPELTYEWGNLALSCTRCNVIKKDKWNARHAIINPYIDYPDVHFLAFGELLWPQPGDDRAVVTLAAVELNRPELLEARRRRLSIIHALADRVARTTNPEVKRTFVEQICLELRLDKEYVFVSHAAAEVFGIRCE